MKVKFSSDDRCAIDLLLQHHAEGPAEAWAPQCFSRSRDGKLLQRVQRVERVLGLLGELPATEPSANLVARTLRRVERDGRRPAAQVPAHITQATVQTPPRAPASHRHVH